MDTYRNPQRLNYLRLAVKHADPIIGVFDAIASEFSEFAQVRGVNELPTGVKLFEHLRVGWVHFTPGDICWEYHFDRSDWSETYKLNSPKAVRTNLSNPVSISNAFIRSRLTSDFDASGYRDSNLSSEAKYNLAGAQYNPWSFDDYGGGPFCVGQWHEEVLPHVTNYRYGTDDIVWSIDKTYPSLLKGSVALATETLKETLGIGRFDEIINDFSHVGFFPSSHGGALLSDMYKYVRGRGPEECPFDSFFYAPPAAWGSSRQEAVKSFFNQGEFDNNVGFAVKDNDLYQRFGKSNLNGMVILGELPETVQLVIDILRFGKFFVNPLKLGQQYKTFASLFSSMWLNWNFGLAPTIDDVKSLISRLTDSKRGKSLPPVVSQLEYLRSDMMGFGPDGVMRGYITNADGSQYDNDWLLYPPFDMVEYFGPSQSVTGTALGEGPFRYYLRDLHYIRRKIFIPEDTWRKYNKGFYSSSAMGAFLESVGFHQDARILSEVADAFWELIPWSWLIDYFINLGDLFQEATMDNADIIKMAQVSSVRFSGMELGVVDNPNIDFQNDTANDSLILYPIAHFGVREFRRSTGVLEFQENTESSDLVNSESLTIPQLLNVAAVLAQRFGR